MTDIFEANGARFIAADDMIVRHCRSLKAEFEPETTAWMFAVMASGDGAFIDIGASTGWFSIPMVLKGYEAMAFEPNPNVYSRLKDNMALNGVTFEAREVAVSNRNGAVTMWINPAVPLTSGGSIEVATCAMPREIMVSSVKLDDCSLAPRLIKADVEGHEMSVLAGAEETINRHRPHMVLEANTDVQCYRLAQWLRAHGYTFKCVDGRNMLCTPE